MLRDTARIFFHCMHRELCVYKPQLTKLLINNTLLLPIILTLSVAYLQARSFFGDDARTMSTLIFAGNIIIPLMTTAFTIMFNLFFDLQGPKYITYQMTILSPKLVLLQRLLFGWLLAFTLTLPFYPVGKLLLRTHLNTAHTNWPAVFAMVLTSTLFCTSYHLLAAIYITRASSINTFWARINGPMLSLGGLFIPLFTMQQFSALFGTLIYLNPAIYITDGLRQAIIGGNQFLPLWLCMSVLTGCSVVCFVLSLMVFKKRLDHI